MTRLNIATYVAWAAACMFAAMLFAIHLYPKLTEAIGQTESIVLLAGFLFGTRSLSREISLFITMLLRRHRKRKRKGNPAR